MTDYLLVAIIVILALNLLVNVAEWSRQSAVYSRCAYSVRAQRRRFRTYRLRRKKRSNQ